MLKFNAIYDHEEKWCSWSSRPKKSTIWDQASDTGAQHNLQSYFVHCFFTRWNIDYLGPNIW